MIKKITVQQIKSCIDGIDIASYCNQVDYTRAELSKSLSSLNISLSNLVKTQCSGVDYFEMQHTFRSKESDVESCLITISFKLSKIEDKFTFILGRDGYDKFLQTMANVVYMITEGARAVGELNKQIHEAQSSKGASTVILYRWGITDKFCKVFDWDYDKVKIKLSKTSMMQLIDLVDAGELSNYIDNTDWSISIKGLISQFNRIPLHEKINAAMATTDIEKILTENMLSVEDIVAVIGRSKGKTGIQEIKSVSVVKELGKFIAIANWKIDYSKKAISMQIMNNKVLDIENDRFISDRDILDRMDKKLNISSQISSRMFG